MDLPTSAIFQLRRLVDLDRGIKTLSLGLGVSPRCPSPNKAARGDLFYSSCFRRSYTDLIPCRIIAALLSPVFSAQYSSRLTSSCDSRMRVLSVFGSSVGLPVRGAIASPSFVST